LVEEASRPRSPSLRTANPARVDLVNTDPDNTDTHPKQLGLLELAGRLVVR
jgi:hypothetical protein